MGKFGSTILTFLFSIPVTAAGFMAIFGVPPISSLKASPSDDIVIRDPYAQDPWEQASADRSSSLHHSQDAPLYNGGEHGEHQHGGHQHDDNESSAPARRPNLFREKPQPRDTSSFNNNFAGNSAPSQPISDARHFPNQPLSSHAHTEPAVHASTNGTRNPFGPGNSSARPNTTETSAKLLDWQQASARLTELGIKKYHLERGGEEGMFLFVCLYHPSESPQVTHRFEAEGDNPLVAVNQVLSQVDGWLQKQYQEGHRY